MHTAITSAPTAPMAPPSVGVAMPRKMVPSTRKISASGGISTNVTRSAMFDSKPSLVTLLRTAAMKATPTPTHIEVTIFSSSAVPSGRVLAKATAAMTETTVRMLRERRPEVPSASRMVRASGGRAGTYSGLIRLTSTM